MIDEQELYGLADSRLGPRVAWRSAGQVMARGRRLRRRRQAVRSAGLGGAVVGMVGASVLAMDRKDERSDVAADATTTADPTQSPPSSIPDCVWNWPREEIEQMAENPPPHLDPAEVPDEMRVLPAYVPGDEPIEAAFGTGPPEDPCDAPAFPADDALTLRSLDAAGVVASHISLSGPLPWSTEQLIQVSAGAHTRGTSISVTDVPFRGGTAKLVDGREAGSGLTFEWTGDDGWSWELRGHGVDEATLRAVGEALALDSAPGADQPVAALPAASVPAGMEVAWQQLGAPAPVTQDVQWDISIGRPPPEPNRIDCLVQVSRRQGVKPITAYGGVGTGYRTVNGHDAAWSSETADSLFGMGNALTWEIAPGLLARAGCAKWTDGDLAPLAIDEVVRFAESLEPVAADDPRLP